MNRKPITGPGGTRTIGPESPPPAQAAAEPPRMPGFDGFADNMARYYAKTERREE